MAIVNSAAMNICIQGFEYLFSILGVGIHLGVELLGRIYPLGYIIYNLLYIVR